LPFVTNTDNKKVTSKSGTDHLNVYGQGRALFTIDGLWQSSTAIVHNDRVDAGLAFLPKLNSSIESRTAYADSHCFTTFNTSSVSEQKDTAISLLLKYFVDNTAYWCKGGKAAVRSDTLNDEKYKALEWSFVSDNLDKIQLPENVYTNNAITKPIGEYCSKLCEGTLSDVASALNEAAKESKELAEKQQ
jgi:multiple sugar transport system substrate-binding protein